MTETLQLRGRFAGLDLDALVDGPVVRTWLYWGMFWLMVAPTVGVSLSGLFNYPDYLGTHLGLTFGRLRPVHVNGVILGAFSRLFIGECYYLVPRLCGVRVAFNRVGRAVAWVWNMFLAAGLISLPLGYNHGLEAGELPLLAEIPIFICTVSRHAAVPDDHRPAARSALYVALWYLIGAFVWTSLNLVSGQLHPALHDLGHQQRGLPRTLYSLHRRSVDHAGRLRADLLFPAAQRAQSALRPQALAGRVLVAGAVLSVRRHSPLSLQPDRRLGRDAGDHHLHAADHSGVDRAGQFLRHGEGPLARVRGESAGEVPDHGRDHVSLRLLSGLDRGAALDPAADPFHRLRHLTFASHGVRNLRRVGDGRTALSLAALCVDANCGRSRSATGRSG